jgi:hypothetical protein
MASGRSGKVAVVFDEELKQGAKSFSTENR